MDLSKLSDEELDKMVAQKKAATQQDYSKMSDEELDRLVEEKKKSLQPPQEGMMKRMARGTLGSLPYAGGTIGTVLGAPAGPGGMIAGAGTGAFLGTALKKAGEGLLDGEIRRPTVKGLINSFQEPLENTAFAMGAEALPVGAASKGLTKLAEKISGKAPVLKNELQFTKNGWFAPSSQAGLLAEKTVAPAAEAVSPGLLAQLGDVGKKAGIGGAVGGSIASALGMDYKTGAGLGALANNPAALKVLMQQARSGNAAAMKALSDPTIQAAIKQGSGKIAQGLLSKEE